ncbi:MAG TPA: hypothetical protein PLF01_07380 [Alphaproteobacteria bacterium]|nr:hypothetical protein [Alphaproteobacteria bacterium]
MSRSKIILTIISSLIIAAGIFLYLNFGNLAKNAAEKIASNALGVNVSISSLQVSLKEKSVVVRGVKIANPPGFKKSYIMTTDEIDIGLKAASRQLIDFNDIQVHGTVVNLEVTEKGTNLQALKNLAAKKPQKESVASEQVRVIVRKMVVNESTINPSITLLDRDIGSIDLPPVRISGIGTKSNGVLAREAVAQIIIQYLGQAETAARKAGAMGGADAVLDNVKGAVDDAAKSIKGLFN